jgi:hypothetical protein
MPKNTACPGVPWVNDPITDQEMAFAHLVLSGTMDDRRAAEAVGLNPDTAAYTKAKPRVHAYMIEHRAAVNEKLVDQEADLSRLPRPAVGRAVDGLRQLNLGRDQILGRLWELATLSHEVTRGTIAGQIKALSMIVAIEGLVPDRRLSPSATQPAVPPVKAQIYESQWRRKQQHQPVGEEPGDPVAGTKTPPAAPQVPHPEPAPEPTPEPAPELANDTSSPNLDPKQPRPANPFINPERLNWVPEATGCDLRRRSLQWQFPQAVPFPK